MWTKKEEQLTKCQEQKKSQKFYLKEKRKRIKHKERKCREQKQKRIKQRKRKKDQKTCNAAIRAREKGGGWARALKVFGLWQVETNTITHSAPPPPSPSPSPSPISLSLSLPLPLPWITCPGGPSGWTPTCSMQPFHLRGGRPGQPSRGRRARDLPVRCSSSLHSEACNALGASGGVVHSNIFP